MSVLPTFLVAGACGLAVAYLIYREWRTVRREDTRWKRELDAAEREDARLARRDARRDSLEALYELPAHKPERQAR